MSTPRDNPFADNPYRTPELSEAAKASFREENHADHSRPRQRGLVGHVSIVALFMLLQGFAEIAFGIGMLFMAAFFGSTRVLGSGQDQKTMVILLGVIAMPGFICGILHTTAGVMNYFFQGRIFGLIAMGIGLLTFFTAYCAPTAIGLAIYGMIVYVNEPVIHAFALRKAGKSREEVLGAFPPAA